MLKIEPKIYENRSVPATNPETNIQNCKKIANINLSRIIQGELLWMRMLENCENITFTHFFEKRSNSMLDQTWLRRVSTLLEVAMRMFGEILTAFI